jgi:predicted CoA-substrate-specific enzyme activase
MTKKKYIGIDCGSVGIKLVLIDDNKILKTCYLKNEGIIDTIKKGLKNIAGGKIAGVGVTGSGRNFVGMLVGSDIIKTEILAHTVGALHYHPDVRTIMDIGGEDSKIMSVKNGVLENFIMNSICGAGTGAVIDTIANRMGIKIEDVGNIALDHKQRLNFPGKCGVFTQSSVVSRLNSGANKSDILMGVVNALVNNYLMLGKGINLQPPYVYQGATALNKAIVRALEEQLNHKVIVPKYSPFMGAIGIALMVKKENPKKTKFKGYDLINKEYRTKNVIANGCDNRCEMTFLYDGDDFIDAIGNRCEKCYPK